MLSVFSLLFFELFRAYLFNKGECPSLHFESRGLSDPEISSIHIYAEWPPLFLLWFEHQLQHFYQEVQERQGKYDLSNVKVGLNCLAVKF